MGALDNAVASNWKTTNKKKAAAQGGGSGRYTDRTINGYDPGEVKSALQKCIRRGDEPQALYWASELLASEMSYMFWRRIAAITAEDIGLADPDMPGRIAALNDLARLNQEWNIPFMAVMLLCRSPKNREADDAAWMYEVRRKKGWKIPIPPEAVDGHTRRGRTRLYQQAAENNWSFEDAWNREFYYDAALLRDPVEIPYEGVPDYYRQQMMKDFGIPFKTYDIDKCDMPRLTNSRREKATIMAGVRAEGQAEIEYEPACDEKTGEIFPGKFWVKSFNPNTPDLKYLVDLIAYTCDCPAFEKSGTGAPCKHLLTIDRLENDPNKKKGA